MKKLKIAMFGHKRIPSREGGVEIVVEQLSTKMVKCGIGFNLIKQYKQKEIVFRENSVINRRYSNSFLRIGFQKVFVIKYILLNY